MIERIATTALAALAILLAAPSASAQGTNDPAGQHAILKAWGYATTPIQLKCYANGSEPAAPAPTLGDIACSTTDTAIRFYTGAAWVSSAMLGGAATFLTVGVGDAPITTATIDGSAVPMLLGVGDDTTTSQGDLYVHRSTGAVAATSGRLEFLKSRGTNAAQTVVVTGDRVAEIGFSAHDGTDFVRSAAILVEAVGTIANNRAGTQVRLFTGTDAAPTVSTLAMTIDEAQNTTFAGTVGLTGKLTGNTSTAPGTDLAIGASFANPIATNPATVGNQAYGPGLESLGSGWETNVGSAMATGWMLQTRPVQGAAAPTSVLDFMSSIDGVAYAAKATLTSAGVLTAASDVWTTSGNFHIQASNQRFEGANSLLSSYSPSLTLDAALQSYANLYLNIDSANVNTGIALVIAHNGTNLGGTELFRFQDDGIAVIGTGEGVAAAATGGVIRAPDAIIGGADDLAAADLTLAAGLGTSAGDAGQLIFQAAPELATGDVLQTLATVMTIDGGPVAGPPVVAVTGDVTINGSTLNNPEFIIEVVAGATDCATGDGQTYFTIPAALTGKNITAVHASRSSANGTTGTMDIQIHNLTSAADILSTKLTIDTGEPDSSTALNPAVIDAAEDDVTTNDIIRIDIDAVHTTPAKGLVLRIQFTL